MSEVTRESLAEGIAENKAAIERSDAHNAEQFKAVHAKLESMTEMFETYTAMKRGGKVIEWASKVIAACLVIWAFVKGGLQFLAEIGRSS